MDLDSITVFVPGGHGFLGSAVTSELGERGVDALPLSRRDGYDFRDPDDVNDVFDEYEPDAVINCAVHLGGIQYVTERPGEIFHDNVLMATHLIEGARTHSVRRLVNPVANCTYPGDLTGTFSEDEWFDGRPHESVLPFATARRASWVQNWAYHRQYGFDSVNLILPSLYGPGDHFDPDRSHALGALVKKFIEADERGESTVTVWGSGEPVREWLYIVDAAEALVRGLTVEAVAQPINVGVGDALSILSLAELIQDVVGFDGEIVLDESKSDGDPHRALDNSRLKEHFDWTPSTELREGIEATVEWYRRNET